MEMHIYTEAEVAINLIQKRSYSVVDSHKYLPDWLDDYI